MAADLPSVRTRGLLGHTPPVMLKSETRPMVDEPQGPVRPQEIRVFHGAVWILHQAVEPHDRRRQLRINARPIYRPEAPRIRHVLEPQIPTDAPANQF